MPSTPSTLDRRVRRLETETGQGPCPECGFDGDWSKLEVTTNVVPLGSGRPRQNCTTCGRPLVIRVRGLGSPRE